MTNKIEKTHLFDLIDLIVLNATFNNISAISWRSVLLVEETGGPEKTTDLSEVTDKLASCV
jgi:Leucine-rich repeat (LRR) protein